jgi:NAD(P)-dependent dehydrogenase (short-subunit alcohol dehydrogenase family)
MGLFERKVVVVTGSAKGIGLATARALIAQGARVHLVDIDPELALRADELGENAHAHTADVTDSDQIRDLAHEIVGREGKTDILINNAGICAAVPAEQLKLEDWRRHLDVNLWGVIHGIQAFLPGMLARGEGHIVNVASMAGLLPFPTVAPYCASKFAVVGLSESLAAELAPRGVRITAVCPGAVRTDLLNQARQDMTGVRGEIIVKLFELACTSPEKQAQDILAAIRAHKTLSLNPGIMLPMYLLQRTSRDLYNGLWQAALKLLLGRKGSLTSS